MHDRHIYDALAAALLNLMNLLNRFRQDDILLNEAALSMDSGRFPLLVRIGAAGCSSVADAVGLDPSTIIRQAVKLESLGLVRN